MIDQRRLGILILSNMFMFAVVYLLRALPQILSLEGTQRLEEMFGLMMLLGLAYNIYMIVVSTLR